MARWIRQSRKALSFISVLGRAAFSAARHRSWTNAERARWLHFYSPVALRAFAVNIQLHGVLPARGLVVSNHLSYLDILTLSSVFPCTFVSKDDVERWPVVGWLCKVAGTIFVDRRSRLDTYRVNDLVRSRLQGGAPVVVFPEGTSSDGSKVLQFHSSLFQPAIEAQAPITPVHISYAAEDGHADTDVCFWGEMIFVPHLWRMLGTNGIKAVVRVGEPQLFSDRKTAALESRKAIVALAGIVQSDVPDNVGPRL